MYTSLMYTCSLHYTQVSRRRPEPPPGAVHPTYDGGGRRLQEHRAPESGLLPGCHGRGRHGELPRVLVHRGPPHKSPSLEARGPWLAHGPVRPPATAVRLQQPQRLQRVRTSGHRRRLHCEQRRQARLSAAYGPGTKHRQPPSRHGNLLTL